VLLNAVLSLALFSGIMHPFNYETYDDYKIRMIKTIDTNF
jgi:hypothetical protein